MLQYFLYRYKFQPLAGNSRYFPSYEFLPKYPECTGIASLSDELVPEGMYKTLPNGQISGLRIGKLEWETAGMAALNFSDADVVQELSNFGRDFSVKIVSKDELAGFIRAYTNVPETETNLFQVSSETENGGIKNPAVYIDCR